MKSFFKIVFLSLVVFFISVCFSGAMADVKGAEDVVSQEWSDVVLFDSSFHNLSEMTDKFSEHLSKEIVGKNVYLDRTTMREMISGSVCNFSSYLQNELESSLSKRGLSIVYESDKADCLIGSTFQRHEGKVKVFFKYHKADLSGKKSRVYEIGMSKLPVDSFKESINVKVYELASNIVQGQTGLRVYIQPVIEGDTGYVSDFSNSLTSRVKCAIVGLCKGIQVIDEKPIYERLSNTAQVRKKAEKVKNLNSSDAFFVDANAVLDGKYFDRGDDVTVYLYLRSLDGAILNSSTVDIKRSLIKCNLQNSTAKKLMDFIDASEKKADFHVKISTTKGSNFPIFYANEKIKFHIQVADPLHMYLYNINTKGDVFRLFPYEKEGDQPKLVPGRLYTIPADMDEFEIEAKSPFGMEAVKVFASSVELPLPEVIASVPSESYNGNERPGDKKREEIQDRLSRMKSINPKDLVDYYRGLAKKLNITVYEDSLLLETRKK